MSERASEKESKSCLPRRNGMRTGGGCLYWRMYPDTYIRMREARGRRTRMSPCHPTVLSSDLHLGCDEQELQFLPRRKHEISGVADVSTGGDNLRAVTIVAHSFPFPLPLSLSLYLSPLVLLARWFVCSFLPTILFRYLTSSISVCLPLICTHTQCAALARTRTHTCARARAT